MAGARIAGPISFGAQPALPRQRSADGDVAVAKAGCGRTVEEDVVTDTVTTAGFYSVARERQQPSQREPCVHVGPR